MRCNTRGQSCHRPRDRQSRGHAVPCQCKTGLATSLKEPWRSAERAGHEGSEQPKQQNFPQARLKLPSSEDSVSQAEGFEIPAEPPLRVDRARPSSTRRETTGQRWAGANGRGSSSVHNRGKSPWRSMLTQRKQSPPGMRDFSRSSNTNAHS